MRDASPSARLASAACCADIYQSPLVRSLLGDSLHPGGLALTRAQAKAVGLKTSDHLLDMACGPGISALMLAQMHKCHVTGVDISAAAIERARRDARRYHLDSLASFIVDDATRLPFPRYTFDVALCECATSLFADRRLALSEIARVLKSGGALALSDVTFRLDKLPAALDVPLAQALCIPLRTGPEELARLIAEAGLNVETTTDCSSAIAPLLDGAESLLGRGRSAGVGGPESQGLVERMAAAVQCARQLARQGDLGYWSFVARKP